MPSGAAVPRVYLRPVCRYVAPEQPLLSVQATVPTFHKSFWLLYFYRGIKKIKDQEHELLDYRMGERLICLKEKVQTQGERKWSKN